MAKEYRVYKLKYGNMKFEIDFMDRKMANQFHKNEIQLSLAEFSIVSLGYNRIGEITEKLPTIIETVEDEDTENEDE